MPLAIKLDIFEGPFDLLCHLLDENRVDIYDIPIAEITAQYLEYLDAMANLDLEVASEFLVLAATLIAIKTKMLLPVVKKDDTGEFPEGYYQDDDDPRSDLVRQILEYKKYRELAESFRELAEEQKTKIPRSNDEEIYVSMFRGETVLKNVSVDKLRLSMEKVIDRMKQREIVHTVSKENITVEDRMHLIESRLQSHPEGFLFSELYDYESSHIRVIIVFLALLELIRRKKIRVLQKENYGEILLYPYDGVKPVS
ncbi:MAG: segregation/condensation protein A [Bacillota bacterium]|nr:segregation/condensation protein A [Bacillota bacterium]